MRIFNEEQLLDEGFRKSVIDEIEGDENLTRKAAMKKRYEVYKDNTKEYVLEMMQAESQDSQITKEIIHRLSNISFCKKIIEKKAMVYKDGVKRVVFDGDKKTQAQVDALTENVNLNSTMKKTNKYNELFRNALVGVLPYLCPISGKYYYKPNVLMPFLYDAIEDEHNPEIPRAIITSYYTGHMGGKIYAEEHKAGYRDTDKRVARPFRSGDGVDQVIADAPDDEGKNKKEYIWWSNLFHFTTDGKGKVVPGKQSEDLLNPIQKLPYYNFAKDQDGHFWAVGGEDITDGSILLNMLLSDLFYIAKYQGMGIGYMFGKGVPKNAKIGASSFITLEVEKEDPTPQLGFATSNPPIQSHLDMIESYVAYLLSTNKLEPGTVQGKLSASNASSGIQEMVKRAENVDDIQDQREIYRDGEPVLFNLMIRWHNLYLERGELKEDLAQLGLIDEDTMVKLKFPDPQPFLTEKEKIDIIKTRLEIGIDSMIDAIMKDNGDLTEKEAQAKLEKIMQERLKDSNNKMKLFIEENKDAVQEQEQENDSEEFDEAEEESEEIENGK